MTDSVDTSGKPVLVKDMTESMIPPRVEREREETVLVSHLTVSHLAGYCFYQGQEVDELANGLKKTGA